MILIIFIGGNMKNLLYKHQHIDKSNIIAYPWTGNFGRWRMRNKEIDDIIKKRKDTKEVVSDKTDRLDK